MFKSNLMPARDSWRAQKNLVHTRTQGKGVMTPTRNLARPTYEYLRVSCGGMGQQWPVIGQRHWLQQSGDVGCVA